MSPAEKSIWKEEMPKTQKSGNCGLERKYASRLWKAKVRKEERERMEGTQCMHVELISRCAARWSPSGHLGDAPLWTAATWLFPACPHPIFQLALHFTITVFVLPGHFGQHQKQALSRSLALVLGSSPSSLGPGEFRPASSQGWGPGSEG